MNSRMLTGVDVRGRRPAGDARVLPRLQPELDLSLRQHRGAQMAGWFRREIKSVDDIKGLKMRIAGLGGVIWDRLAARPRATGRGRHRPGALERGTIDAAEFVGP
jgi:TRAP-type mannitol/chloroaromatic compound transport system substrate-binding protein